MTKKEINIAGKQYPVEFTMKTLQNFESIVGKSFFKEDLEIINNRIALIIAAVLTADKDSDITVEEMTSTNDWTAIREILAAHAIVMELANDFFEIPEIEKKNNPEPEHKPEDEEQAQKTNLRPRTLSILRGRNRVSTTRISL